MTHPFLMTACAFAACLALGDARAQEAAASAQPAPSTANAAAAAAATASTAGTGTSASGAATRTADGSLDRIYVQVKRETRLSKGAVGLPIAIKDTPQSISTLDKDDMANFGLTGANDALKLATGVNVDQYETNRATFNSRGFEVQLTQIDGVGMTNDWGTVVGQQDTYLFERIELIRGANGMLTGVGNASGTINYIRKRPTNVDGGEVNLTYGQWGQLRGALDYNKVLTQDGRWAGRLVVVHEDKDSYLRALNDKRSTVYGVVDGQIGRAGTLTFGVSLNDSKQHSPMWGSLIVKRVDGTQAEFDQSASTSVDWTYWNTKSQSAFVEYTHELAKGWELKATSNFRHNEENTKLLYAYTNGGGLNLDNTGLYGWPYHASTRTNNRLFDLSVSGAFNAMGRAHSTMFGISRSTQTTSTDLFAAPAAQMYLPLPAFPYGGDAYTEPTWGARTFDRSGEQTLTRLYGVVRLSLSENLKTILGVNAIKLEREGSSAYGNAANAVNYPDTKKTTPYAGLTYDFTPDVMGYVSYSTIFQNQDQTDANKNYLDPVKGKNVEVGVKSEWLNKQLLTTFALFKAEQLGLATYAGDLADKTAFYVPKDVRSKGFEFEATGRLSRDSKMTVGYTRLILTGPDGNAIYNWVPRTTINAVFDTRMDTVPGLRLGVAGRWQSVVVGPNATQGAYMVADAFASYDLNDKTSIRLNVNNLLDKKYLRGIAYGAIYGAPRNAAVTLNYKL
ncbi:TonB-dependent siderophore receptor [Roseateles terrae]|uniref:Outer membrane receptor for ferric coprogen and ferric-rhodotorulic acid n=1 Tax=Roseateles terrae TaxID=431060 RepID=A0ABR6GX78_9BURK|nr:TonB-dependent siderophore receptor [Roseateles terrae]MBB3196674.1 outer membrane receptor for ferric coprogen and ferric-rhodotorulic acid [Roseateles terrae]OWQ84920.1 TonB-dependent siderophore receptor [Roseateles terrae]